MKQLDNSLFGRLRRLFSKDVIVRNIGGNKLKVMDISQIQRDGELASNSLIDRSNRLYTSKPYEFSIPSNQSLQAVKTQLYADYEMMDTDAIIASALNIVADESTLKNDFGEVLKIKSDDEDIKMILTNLFYDVLNIEFNLWGWIRNMCKYGDSYLFIKITEKFGITNIVPLSAYDMFRLEDPETGETKFQLLENSPFSNTGGVRREFDNYEIAHFRLIGNSNFLPHGCSYIEAARKTYKMLMLVEDAALLHRIVRSADKRAFFINVGNIPPNEVDTFMQKVISTVKKAPYQDPVTGDYNLKYNMMNLLEDFYIPVRGGDTSTRIESVSGLNYSGMEDVEYYKNKLYAALNIPKAYFGEVADLNGKSTISQLDIRFCRTIQRIQKIVLSELNRIAVIHLYAQGYTDNNVMNFSLELSSPSIIEQQEKIAIWKDKVDLASQMMDTKLLPTDWIYHNIFNMSEDEYDELRDLVIEDNKRFFRLNQIETEGNDPVETGDSYGTPHDLATIYKNNASAEQDLPDGFDETNPVGRPKKHVSVYGTDASSFGRDPLGKQELNPNRVDYSLNQNRKVSAYQLETVEKVLLKESFSKLKIFDEQLLD